MPYPSQVSRDDIVSEAWQLIEADGANKLSLSKLANALGIKAPSLYRHIGNKAQLLRAVNLYTSQQLVDALNEATANGHGTASEQLVAIMRAYRDFAHEHPNCYILAFTNNDDALRPDEKVLEQMALPLQALVTAVSGPTESLAALRGAMALVHGFIMLELYGQLRRGGDLSTDFESAVQAYLRGWQSTQ